MTKKLWSDAHWFSKAILIVICSVLLCASVGVLELISCLLSLMFGAALGYYSVIRMIQSRKLFPSSKILRMVRNWTRLSGIWLPVAVDTSTPAEERETSEEHSCADDNSSSRVNTELDLCVKFIMRDFVMRWYRNLSYNDQFIRDLQYTLEDVSVAIVSRARKLSPHTLLRKAFICYHSYFLSYLHALKKAQFEYKGNSIPKGILVNDAPVQEYFVGWHFALKSESAEMKHLHNIVNALLEALVPADILRCGLSRKLVTTILVHNVLYPVINLLSDPSWLNDKIALLVGVDNRQACPTSSHQDPQSYVVTQNESTEERDSGVIVGDAHSFHAFERDKQSEDKDISIHPSQPSRTILSLTGTNDSDASEKCDINDQSDNETSSGIWQRIAGEMPSAFRSEREQEISDLVEEASSQNKRKFSKLPMSASLEKISDIFYNALSFDYISNNLAQYFMLSSDDDNSDKSGRVPFEAHCLENNGTIVGASGDCSLIKHSTPNTLNEEKSEVSSPNFQVSSGLQKFLLMTTGPILSERAVSVGGDNHDTEAGNVEDSVGCDSTKSEDLGTWARPNKLEQPADPESSSFNDDVLDVTTLLLIRFVLIRSYCLAHIKFISAWPR